MRRQIFARDFPSSDRRPPSVLAQSLIVSTQQLPTSDQDPHRLATRTLSPSLTRDQQATATSGLSPSYPPSQFTPLYAAEVLIVDLLLEDCTVWDAYADGKADLAANAAGKHRPAVQKMPPTRRNRHWAADGKRKKNGRWVHTSSRSTALLLFLLIFVS
ncbi:hypothetical protein LXL04_038578 [Taraxacum kok-saghyz]